MTNLEWLRSLSAEELAELLEDGVCAMCANVDNDCRKGCWSGHFRWLNEEHKDDKL